MKVIKFQDQGTTISEEIWEATKTKVKNMSLTL